MRKVFFPLFTVLVVASAAFAQSKDAYQYTVDLTNVVDDKVYVELTPPPISSTEITFYLPKIIPGTYAIEDYGRFVSKFEALNKKGKPLPVEKKDVNSWVIKNANQVTKIRYWIEDSFDTKIEGEEIFWPAGTNIEEGKNFLINAAGFFGYFDGMKRSPFVFNVIKPEGFYGATGLIAEQTNAPVSTLKLEKNPQTTPGK
ncbi:MAG: hypothetical protein HC859_04195 [Bacteroidia bacterium]|nr:hypothetical protein [Bacteroidia bacterium]